MKGKFEKFLKINMNIFINLPVRDIHITNTFFSGLGFTFNRQFSSETATCIQINEKAWVMLLSEKYFKNFTKKKISNAFESTEVLIAIDQPSKLSVDEFMGKALALGATEAREVQDLGFMYSRAFNDPDGHIWEVGWMDPSHIITQ